MSTALSPIFTEVKLGERVFSIKEISAKEHIKILDMGAEEGLKYLLSNRGLGYLLDPEHQNNIYKIPCRKPLDKIPRFLRKLSSALMNPTDAECEDSGEEPAKIITQNVLACQHVTREPIETIMKYTHTMISTIIETHNDFNKPQEKSTNKQIPAEGQRKSAATSIF